MEKETTLPKTIEISFNQIPPISPTQEETGWRMTIVTNDKPEHHDFKSEDDAKEFYDKLLAPILEIFNSSQY
ncbi:MAG TPA: hypothetical protein VK543_13795 [Puia sp.]|nr:hypothetical protein [Puia sp.]